MTDVTYDAYNNEATVSYDNKTTTDIYKVTLERVFAYPVTFSNGTSATMSLTINGKSYRDGDVAYLGEHSPEWVSTSAVAMKDNIFEVEPAKAELVVTGNTISVDNATDKITIDDTVSNPTNGTITVAYGSTASAGGIEGALQDGTPITIKNETLPVGDIHNADGAVLTLDGATVPAKPNNGKTDITGEVIASGNTTLEGNTGISHTTIKAGSTLTIKAALDAHTVILEEGATLDFAAEDGGHAKFVASQYMVISFTDNMIYTDPDDLTEGTSFTGCSGWWGSNGALLTASTNNFGTISIVAAS